jgi:DNA-binding NtrC family response regulator
VASILLIDDDTRLGDYLGGELKARGHVVEPLDCAERGLDRLAEAAFDVVLLDNRMPRITGLEFLAEIRSRGIEVPVILMTEAPTTATAIRATALGAFKYVIKPADRQSLAAVLQSEIETVLERARESARLPNVRFAPRATPGPPGEYELLGKSKPMQEVCFRIGLFANSQHTVLIRGETGTGKELVARAIHDEGPRKGTPFVPVNCGAITPTLAESLLFGHKKGAFTGADRDREGVFEQANGGTLFFDEIGDMPLELQVKLLRVLQERRFERVGGTEPVRVDVRVLAATHRNLLAMVREGTFREDLYYRLDRFVIPLPPLRERLEDLPDLIDGFLAREAARGRTRPEVAEATLERLRAYHWPGNVRELENVIERAVALCQGSQILPRHLEFPADGAVQPGPGTRGEAVAALRRVIAWAADEADRDHKKVSPLLHDLLERELVRVALERFGGNKTRAADWLGLARGTVIERTKESD